MTKSREPLLTDEKTSARLGRIRQAGTAPELSLRRGLHAAGIRFRISNRDLPGSPDIANRHHRWAIFVHGCFWHGHEGCSRATVPKRNREFWMNKIAANRRRDARVTDELAKRGYRVLAVWECELARNESSVIRTVANTVRTLP